MTNDFEEAAAFEKWWSAWYEPRARAAKGSSLTLGDLVDLDSEACRTEIADYIAGKPGARLEDVYWFARLAAYFARALLTPVERAR